MYHVGDEPKVRPDDGCDCLMFCKIFWKYSADEKMPYTKFNSCSRLLVVYGCVGLIDYGDEIRERKLNDIIDKTTQ